MLKRTHDLSTGLGRLAQLADDLLEVPKEKFNLGYWAAPCGTAACAAGWCGMLDWAQKLGYSLVELPDGASTYFSPSFEHQTGYRAVIDFFNITMYDALMLFDPSEASTLDKKTRRLTYHPRYSDPVAQSAHMKEFLKEKGYYD